ncbi:hypothetical protein WJX84_010052 [Apatococcus fuscideae]|uniref:Uncharacterized protein n=1 Tax=Apatococcus fuscideae TaxID=2026836 RepID=A0AAW1T2D2_9CHLO
MNGTIQFKRKSALHWDSVTFDGLFLTLRELQRAIALKKFPDSLEQAEQAIEVLEGDVKLTDPLKQIPHGSKVAIRFIRVEERRDFQNRRPAGTVISGPGQSQGPVAGAELFGQQADDLEAIQQRMAADEAAPAVTAGRGGAESAALCELDAMHIVAGAEGIVGIAAALVLGTRLISTPGATPDAGPPTGHGDTGPLPPPDPPRITAEIVVNVRLLTSGPEQHRTPFDDFAAPPRASTPQLAGLEDHDEPLALNDAANKRPRVNRWASGATPTHQPDMALNQQQKQTGKTSVTGRISESVMASATEAEEPRKIRPVVPKAAAVSQPPGKLEGIKYKVPLDGLAHPELSAAAPQEQRPSKRKSKHTAADPAPLPSDPSQPPHPSGTGPPASTHADAAELSLPHDPLDEPPMEAAPARAQSCSKPSNATSQGHPGAHANGAAHTLAEQPGAASAEAGKIKKDKKHKKDKVKKEKKEKRHKEKSHKKHKHEPKSESEGDTAAPLLTSQAAHPTHTSMPQAPTHPPTAPNYVAADIPPHGRAAVRDKHNASPDVDARLEHREEKPSSRSQKQQSRSSAFDRLGGKGREHQRRDTSRYRESSRSYDPSPRGFHHDKSAVLSRNKAQRQEAVAGVDPSDRWQNDQ